MRIRSIKPEFWRSQDIENLSRDVRLLFVGLWSYVDDNGVGVDDFRQIAADLFALADDPTEAREYVRDGLATLSRALLITRYEVDGRPFLFITGWDRHQRIDRPAKPRHPRPDTDGAVVTSENTDSRETVATPSREVPAKGASGTGEQGNRGTGVKTSCSPAPPSSEPDQPPLVDAPKKPQPGSDDDPNWSAFWDAYPRKVSKDGARKAWRAAIKRAKPVDIITGARRYADDPNRTDQYTAHPTTWLNGGRWDDEPIPARPGPNGHQPYQDPDHSAYDEEL